MAVENINNRIGYQPSFRGEESSNGGSNPFLPALGAGVLAGGGAYYGLPTPPTQDAFVKSVQDGTPIAYKTPLTPEQQELIDKAKKAGTSTVADPTVSKGTSVATSEKQLANEVKKLFGGRTEVTQTTILGHLPVKLYERDLRIAEKELNNLQKNFDAATVKHESLMADIEAAEESLSKDAQASIRNDEIDEKGAKVFESEKTRADKDLKSAQSAASNAQKEATNAEAEAVKAEKAAKATPEDVKLQRDAASKRKLADKKQEIYKNKTEIVTQKQTYVKLKEVEAKTARAKANALKAEGDAAIARDLAGKHPTDTAKKAAAAAAEGQAKTARTAAQQAIKEEVAYKRGHLTTLKTLSKKAKTALETAEKKLNEHTFKIGTKRTKLNLAKQAIEGKTNITKEVFETELKNGVAKIEATAGTTSRATELFNQAFKAVEGQLEKVKNPGKATLIGAGVALLTYFGMKMFGGSDKGEA